VMAVSGAVIARIAPLLKLWQLKTMAAYVCVAASEACSQFGQRFALQLRRMISF
jgi:hypothetical protein